MKFEKRFFFGVIPEWKDKYLDYTGLYSQIKLIKKAALNLAKAYANIKAITGDEVNLEIHVDTMASDKIFWRMLEENLDKIEEFYKKQLQQFTEQFHVLTLQGLMDEYVPFTRGLSTRLERELERLSLPGQIELSTLVKKDEAAAPLVQEGYLFHLDRNTRVDDVIERIRRAGASGAFQADDNHSHSSDEDDSDEEHARSRHVALRSRLRRERSVDAGDSNPESGYDSDKSEEEVLEKDSILQRPGALGRKRSRNLSTIKLRPLSQEDVQAEDHRRMAQKSQSQSRFRPNLSGATDSVEMQPLRHSSGNDYILDIPEDEINIDDDDFPLPPRSESMKKNPSFVEVDIDDEDRDDEDIEPLRRPQSSSSVTGGQKVFATDDIEEDDYDYNIDDDDIAEEKKQMIRQRLAELEHQHEMRVRQQDQQTQQQQQQQQQNPFMPNYGAPPTGGLQKSRSKLLLGNPLSFSSSSAPPPPRSRSNLPKLSREEREKAANQLRSALSEFYRGIILLQNFATLNVEATQKILKKHDKNIELGAREKFTQSRLTQFSFYRRRSLKALMRETEHVFAVCFTEGHRTEAMKVLRVPTEKKSVGVATFRFGFFLGISIAFFAVCMYLTTVLDTRLLDKMRPGLIVYRMLAITVLMTWYWGVDMWVWTRHRVNYVFIFEFNPRRHVRYQHVFEAASILTFVLVANLLIYMLTASQDGVFGWEIPGFTWLENIPPHLIPLSLLIVIVFIFLWIQIKSSFWLVRTLCRIMAAPFVPVVFRDFFIADQVLSIVISLQDLEYVVCYYATDAWTGSNSCLAHQPYVFPLIAAFPSLWRLLQCIRRFRDTKDVHQLINAGKYFSGLVVITMSAVRRAFPSAYTDIFWFVSIFVSTVFTFAWDVIKDWSLGQRSVKHCLLRSELLYPTPWYYTALLMNLGMRLMWTLTISPEAVRGTLHPDVFAFILAIVEVTRRAVWNMFRLENEQLNNCGKFRAIKDIPLPLPVGDANEEE